MRRRREDGPAAGAPFGVNRRRLSIDVIAIGRRSRALIGVRAALKLAGKFSSAARQ